MINRDKTLDFGGTSVLDKPCQALFWSSCRSLPQRLHPAHHVAWFVRLSVWAHRIAGPCRPISSHSAVISIVHGIADNSCHVPDPFCARDHTVHQMNQIRWLRNLGTWSSSCDTGPVGFITFLCCNTTPRRNWSAAISESP